jgi:hypothetical protein
MQDGIPGYNYSKLLYLKNRIIFLFLFLYFDCDFLILYYIIIYDNVHVFHFIPSYAPGYVLNMKQ